MSTNSRQTGPFDVQMYSDCPLCGINISAVHCLVLSQSTREMNRQTDGQNYDSQDRASIAASRCKNIIQPTTRCILTNLVLIMSLNETVADERPLTPQWGTPDDASPRLRREEPDGLNDTSA